MQPEDSYNMDVTNLILYLKSKITDQSIDQQMVSKAIRLLELGAVFTAESFSALPSAAGRSGELWFVLYDGLYWSTGEYWVPIAQTSFGVLWSWGCNSAGQLGTNTVVSRSSPVSVVTNITAWCRVSASESHSLAIQTNGLLWTWGCNQYGKLGDNTSTNRSSPVSVVGGFTNWCQGSASATSTVAVRTSGSAWSWGRNSFGQLGDNTTTSRSSPVSVVGGFSDWCQVGSANAGTAHALAVRSNGTLWAWGAGFSGQLGNNAASQSSSPVSVVGGFSDWCQSSLGNSWSVAVRTSGSAWAWGANSFGQIGDNSTTGRSSPVSVVGGFSDWCQVSAAIAHVVAVRTNGTAWAWGCNSVGQLGDNTTTNKSSPVSVVGGFTNWCQAGAGGVHSALVRTNGTAWSWGCNNMGQLGDNTITSRSSPVSVAAGFTDWSMVSSGNSHTMAIRSKTL